MDEPVPLEHLYRLVPAAEEEDLLEEVALERDVEEWEALRAEARRLDAALPEPGIPEDPAPDDGEATGWTHHQALAFLHEQLGAEEVDGGQPSAGD